MTGWGPVSDGGRTERRRGGNEPESVERLAEPFANLAHHGDPSPPDHDQFLEVDRYQHHDPSRLERAEPRSSARHHVK
jgi:hypothetical protein